MDVLGRLAEAVVMPGGCILIEEPDVHSVLASDSAVMRDFWQGFLAWAANHGIDYFIGRRLAPLLASLGLQQIVAHGETILLNGGSLPARYLKLTMQELEQSLLGSGRVGPTVWNEAKGPLRQLAISGLGRTATSPRPETSLRSSDPLHSKRRSVRCGRRR